jgi:hypothetical protein
MTEQMIKVTARFMDGESGLPLTGPKLKVRFLDKDFMSDDILGESSLAPDGRAEVVTTTSRFHSGLMGELGAKIGEARPDVYCEVRDAGIVVYRSKVAWDIDVENKNAVTGGSNRTIDLGTFKFERGEGLSGDVMGDKPLKPQF